MRALALAIVVTASLGTAGHAHAALVTVSESRPSVVRAAGATIGISLAADSITLRARARHKLRATVTEQRRGRRARRLGLRLSRRSQTLVLTRTRSRRQRILLRLRAPGARPHAFRIEVPAAHDLRTAPALGELPAALERPPSARSPAPPAPDGHEPAVPGPGLPGPGPPGDPPDPPPAELAGDPLRWTQPQLEAPVDVYVSAANRALRLDAQRDYVVHMPATPLSVSGGLTISGGRNVVLVGGRISIPWQGASPQAHERRGLFLKDQHGTVHVEGLLIDGPDVSEGINLDQGYGATVQLQSVRVEGLHARDEVGFSDTHPDVIQTWNGPDRLLVDRLTGSTDYQGFFLRPQEKGGPPPTLFAFSDVNLVGSETAGHLLWKASEFPVETSDAWVSPNPHKTLNATLWPSPAAWLGVQRGLPPGGDFVPMGAVGTQYASPGFVASGTAAGMRCHYLSTVGPAPAPRRCE